MPLPSLKTVKWVTADCYGTLIDWEKGIIEACKKEAAKDGFSFEEEPFLARFMEVQAEIMAGSYELYAEVLRRTIVKVAGELGWEVEPSRAQFLPNSVAYWLPFRGANAAMDRLGKKYDIGIISNVDGPVLPAISFVPARMTTAAGWRWTTSCWKRTSICGVVCPLMPRFTYGLPGKNTPVVGVRPQASVMESPKKTTRWASGAAGGRASLSALYRARSGQYSLC